VWWPFVWACNASWATSVSRGCINEEGSSMAARVASKTSAKSSLLARIGLPLDFLGQFFDRFGLLNDVERKHIDVHLLQLIAKLVGQGGKLCGIGFGPLSGYDLRF